MNHFLLSSLVLNIILFTCNATEVTAEEDGKAGPLVLTELIEKGEIDKARDLSMVDPTLFDGVYSHAGFITVNKLYKWHTFFWFFPAEEKPLKTTPWVIWLQGGPGGSSLFGLFYEIGPIQYINGTVSKMPVTWASDYSLLFIDNPVGTGFSYSEDDDHYIYTDEEAGVYLLKFIEQFLQLFPELQRAPLFIAGESYAGKYIPTFGYQIHHNMNKSIPINLRGLAIGDGWIDPPTLLHWSNLAIQLGILDFEQGAEQARLEDDTRTAWNEGRIEDYNKNYDKIMHLIAYVYVSEADNFLKDGNENYTFPSEDFLNRRDVQAALHIGRAWPYQSKNESVFQGFNSSGNMYYPAKHWLEDLLEHYPVMCYTGQLDFGLGYALSEHTYRSLNWSGAEEYLRTPRKPIPSRDPLHTLDPIGYVKGSGNFMEVMVRAAGHMVPMDQPRAMKQVIDMFIEKYK